MSPVMRAVERLRSGRPVLLVDDDPAPRGWLTAAAETVDAGSIASISAWAPGPIRLARPIEDGLAPPAASDADPLAGVSAAELAAILREAAASAQPGGGDLGRLLVAPAVSGGVLRRAGPAEGAVDLARCAGLRPAAVLAAVQEGAERVDLLSLSARHDLPMIAISDIIAHRMTHETLVEAVAQAPLPSAYAADGLVAHAFRSRVDGVEHLALVKGAPAAGALVRLHSECLTGDVLGSLRCDCGEQLRAAMARIGASRSGALIYLRGHEGRGIGLANKIAAYALQDQGLDTADANAALGFAHDGRDYGVAAQILRALGLDDISLLTNNPRKTAALRRYGVRVVEELPLVLGANPHNAVYLATKRDRMGHRFPGEARAGRAVEPDAA